MNTIINELQQKQNVRANLSNLRKLIKEEANFTQIIDRLGDGELIIPFLKSEDAKTRKNAALLLGDLECQEAKSAIWEAYDSELTQFVKGSYLSALSMLDVEDDLDKIKEILKELTSREVEIEDKKHVDEQIRELRKILVIYEGISHHTFSAKGIQTEVLLLCNRENKEVVKNSITIGKAKVHPLGVLVETDDLISLMTNRLYREMLFPVHTGKLLSEHPQEAAKELWNSDLYDILSKLHKEAGTFYFRLECKSPMTLEKRSAFAKKFTSELERQSNGKLVNSTADYEIEIRLIANKEGKFFPCVKLYTIRYDRFAYRKNHIAASIHPSTAALIMELSEPYLKENAQVMDPFCGVGTMLIERDIKKPVKEMYATDIYGEAIDKGRENAKLAGERINFIHRDFFDFKHSYPFDEIVTNMPLRGKKTKEEMDQLYDAFFKKVPEILAKEAVVIMYTNEIGFVKKQLRIHKEYTLLQEYCMQKKNEFYLLIIGYRE